MVSSSSNVISEMKFDLAHSEEVSGSRQESSVQLGPFSRPDIASYRFSENGVGREVRKSERLIKPKFVLTQSVNLNKRWGQSLQHAFALASKL